ncbi:hypothetical protein QEZ54_12255 [Catellatospora sp. KI3]|uniref:hypothetical protein n=1 Tax=Catellatospora sp. KI3 TaxID=3041620 RepID=UPI002482AC40|nr:hypothetical protein [Catellatospora sp. KI3]MDI1461747.1 hypothetical protein [Catellatospora sp. KI3]
MSDDSFLDRVFGPPPQVAAMNTAAPPAPPESPPAAPRRRRRAALTSRRYALLVAAMVGLTALPTWIVLRAGMDGLDPDFGARLAGPVRAFTVPGEPQRLLPEYPQQRPTRPAPQSDPVTGRPAGPLVIAAGPPREVNGAEPVLERRRTAKPPAPRPVWHPAKPAKPAKPGRPTGPVGRPGGDHAGPRNCPPHHRPGSRPGHGHGRGPGHGHGHAPGHGHGHGPGHGRGSRPGHGQGSWTPGDPIHLKHPKVKHPGAGHLKVERPKVKHPRVKRPHSRHVGHGHG